jgi:hypothetical protein
VGHSDEDETGEARGDDDVELLDVEEVPPGRRRST